jgi:hypothetical protein
VENRKGNFAGRKDMVISRDFAELVIGAYNMVSTKKLEASNQSNQVISGFSFLAEDFKKLLEEIGTINENQRIVLLFGYHRPGVANANEEGTTLIATRMSKGLNGEWLVPDDATMYDYCEPCPNICPDINFPHSNDAGRKPGDVEYY